MTKKSTKRSKAVVRAQSPADRERIISIAEQIVAGQIKAGKLNPEDDGALRAATRQAVLDAHAAFYAAVEYIGG